MKTCFLISPMGGKNSEVRKNSDLVRDLIVLPACEKHGYSVIRADTINSASVITQEIIKYISTAELVIADLTNSNPNVMYELGIRHAINLPSIQLMKSGGPIPFDLASIRTIIYELVSPKDILAAVRALENTIEMVEKREATFVSPVELIKKSSSIAERLEDRTAELNPILLNISERLDLIDKRLSDSAPSNHAQKSDAKYSRDVFIVHGHDGELKNELARFLSRIDFNPIILHEQPDRGQTIIQKLQLESSRVGFAFIIHTPDDVGKVKNSEELNPRSRQNVVFEHGMFVGQFTHKRVCALVREGVEIPTDLGGVIYKKIPKDSGISAIIFEIANELRAAGYMVDANKL